MAETTWDRWQIDIDILHIDGSVQDCSNSSALEFENRRLFERSESFD